MFRTIPALSCALLTAAMLHADPATDHYYRFDMGTAADFDGKNPAFVTQRDRIGDIGSEGDVDFRLLMPKVYQVGIVFPAFDFDPQLYGAINHSFYVTFRFKDIAKKPISVYTGKGGAGFHGAGDVGTFGGAGDGAWKEETVIVPRSMMRTEDGKTFRLALNGIDAAVPVDWMMLFSADAKLPDLAERIAAAEKSTKEKREALRRRLLAGFKDLGLPDPGEQIAFTATEQARGFRAFFPPVSRQLFTNSRARREELTDAREVFACPGEAETVYVAVRALKDLGKVTLSLSDLKGPGTVEFSKASIRWAVWSEQRVGSSWGKDFRVAADQLVESSSWSVKPERLEIAAITFRVSADAPGGDYSGKLNLVSETGGKAAFDVKLTVYPFKLEHPAHSTHGLFYYTNYGNYNPLELMDQREHGMNMTVSGTGVSLFPAGRAGSPEGIHEVFRAMKELGFRAPIVVNTGYMSRLTDQPTPDNRKKYADLIRQTLDIARKEGFAEVGFFPVDEPHTDPLIQKALTACTWTKDVPGASTFITSNPKAVPVLEKVLNYVCYNLSYITPERIAEVKKAGETLMWYCPSFDVNPESNRYHAGFYLVKTGAQSAQYFAYMCTAGDVFVDLDGPNRDWNVVYPSMTSPFHDPTVAWEAMREGVDDYEYAYTLKAMAERAKKAGKTAQAAKALKVLDDILAHVDVDGKKAGGPAISIEADTRRKDEQIDPAKLRAEQSAFRSTWYDESRWKIADAIVELQKATK